MARMEAPWLEKKNLEEWLKTSILDITLKDSNLKGDNYMSNIYRVHVKTKEGDKALIVKCRLQDSELASALTDVAIFKKEEEIYRNMLPKMDKLLKESNLGYMEPLAPKCLYSCEDFLVLEDLSALGYKMFDRCHGLDLQQCLVVMRTIALYHAAATVLHEQDPQSMEKFNISFFSDSTLLKGHLQTMTKLLIEEMETWPAVPWGPYVEKLRGIYDDFAERLLKVCKSDESHFNTLVHGDMWASNILYRGDVVRLIDYQLVNFTSPAIDLMLFLTTSTNMEVRINHTDNLIQEYHRTLCSALTALGSKTLLTLEDVYEMYRSKAFYGLFGVISEAAIMTADPDCGFKLEETTKGKTPGRQMYSEFFRDIVKWDLQILDRMGAFDYKRIKRQSTEKMDTVTPPSWLDKKFLENALGKEVADFEVRPMGGKNENFTSNLFGVVVELKTNESEHLFVKKIMDTSGDEQSVQESSMFDRETHMYSVVLPKMSALLEKAYPGCEPIAPRHVFSSPGVLVLEDLSASGFKMLDRLTGLDLHHSLLVMKNLAKFHSASVVLQEQEPECFKLYAHQIYTEPAMEQSLGHFFTSMTLLLADEIESWPVYGERYSKKIREMSGRMMQLAVEAARRREDRFNVLTHDDLWINNILFRSPDSVRLIDFQMPYYSSIGNDLQLFVNSSLTADVRRNHIDTLLKEYHTTFCESLKALGFEGRILTFEDLKEEFRKSASYSLIITLVFLPIMYINSDTDIPMFESKGKPTINGLYDDIRIRDTMIEMINYYEKQGAFDAIS